MSLAVVHTRALVGMHAEPVAVEVHLANGLPSFSLVGLPDTEVRESRDRVRAAIQTAGFDFPQRRVTVNLAPADLPKESGRFDLPIALGILAASGQIPADRLAEAEYAGELGLSGELRPIRGGLPMALAAAAAGKPIVLPAATAGEAARTQARILSAQHLLEVASHLMGQTSLPQHVHAAKSDEPVYPDLAEVRGQTQAKRALEIAAAGQHHLLLQGPPGCGKSMLAARLPGIMPPLLESEALESAAMLSLVGAFEPSRFGQRVVRAPHHGASAPALVGGGSPPRPGEISLAHHGVLFLDELPEFDRRALEALREPLETGQIEIARMSGRASFPARLLLVAAMNPCPCGYLGSRIPAKPCRCTPDQVARYRGKLSGPLMDRIDLHVNVPAISPQEMERSPRGEASAEVRARVIAAHERQMRRQGKPNARLGPEEITRHCALDAAGQSLLERGAQRLGLSARGVHRCLRIARTIADLAGAERLSSAHVAEAIAFRA